MEVGGELGCSLTDLTPLGAGEEHADVQGLVVGASEDGSSVYFVANGVLSGTEANERGEKAQSGQPNLYRRHDGVTSFIVTLTAGDSPDWAVSLAEFAARVSPDGRWLAFMSQRSLTGYDNRDASSGKPDEEVYLYDANPDPGQRSLVCASCNPTGGRPHGIEYEHMAYGIAGGNRVWEKNTWLAANIPGWTPYKVDGALYQSRYLSDSGRLFFNSSDALVPSDTNKTEDVYQYEPPGTGDCTEADGTFSVVSGGCVGLISSGSSPVESGFLDASENGNDVFFLTQAELVPGDVDTSYDVYDAHACSASSPCPPPPPPPPPACQGDACQSPVEAPNDPTPGSLTFQGPGNPVPGVALSTKKTTKNTVKCKRPKQLSHGRCVKSNKKKAKKAKKASNDRGAKR